MNPGADPASQARVPAAAAWLGTFGAVPFIALAVASLLVGDVQRDKAVLALATYGAVILSFLGGIHWGLAIAGFGPKTSDAAFSRRLILSIVPSLVGWGALLLPPVATLGILAFAFAAMLWVDVQASDDGEAPAWYPRLRWPLTAVVVICLATGVVA